MGIQVLSQKIKQKQSFLCIGLDPVPEKLPGHLKGIDGLHTFCTEIIHKTKKYAVAYKPNLAFFEQYGPAGLEVLQSVLREIPQDCFTIADAKRGDIGNTAAAYARTFFETYGFDAVTVSPYLGQDSLIPFFEYNDKVTIVLAKTSNSGSADFQDKKLAQSDEPLYLEVIRRCMEWSSAENTMFVVGANYAEELQEIRSVAPDYFFLIPGFGAQGGTLAGIKHILKPEIAGVLANYSRQIIYSSPDIDFADAAAEQSKLITIEMQQLLATV